MKTKEFDRLANATKLRPNSKMREALRLVKVDGLSAAEACRQTKMDQAAFSRAIHRFPSGLCSGCGRPLRNGATK